MSSLDQAVHQILRAVECAFDATLEWQLRVTELLRQVIFSARVPLARVSCATLQWPRWYLSSLRVRF